MKASVTTAATAATPTAAAVTGAVGSIGAGGIAASSFAAAAITSTVIATDAIGAAQVAASAVAEIQSGLATGADVTAATAPLATSLALAAVQADTDDIQTRLPAALVAGRIDASVGAMATDTITASALAASAVSEIQSGLAVPGSAMTLQADAITAATIAPGAIGASEAPLLGTISTATGQTVDALYNAKRLNGAGLLIQYAGDGVTPAYQATVTDKNGDPIVLQAGEPARTTALVAVP